jgi:hypothetical protein
MLVITTPSSCSASVLSPDMSIITEATQLLTGTSGGGWTVSSDLWSISVPAIVPGDLLSDLQINNVIGDPLFELGFLNTTTPGAQGSPIWDTGNWTYTTTFAASAEILNILNLGGTIMLVFDGVKMAATITLNGKILGIVNDQFLRFTFPLDSKLLLPTNNLLTVTFSTSRDPANAEGRFSGACEYLLVQLYCRLCFIVNLHIIY